MTQLATPIVISAPRTGPVTMDLTPSLHSAPAPSRSTWREELLAFICLALLIWPVVAVGIVGGYGFLVWMSQLIFGPPGPPH